MVGTLLFSPRDTDHPAVSQNTFIEVYRFVTWRKRYSEELPVNHKYHTYLTICLESLKETEGMREKEIIGGDNKKIKLAKSLKEL